MTLNTPAQAHGASPVLVTLGQIVANENWVTTPAGSWELKDANVTLIDQTRMESRIPVWAIVTAVITFLFFFLGLLFLLAKENVITGYITLTVTSDQGHVFTEHVPVNSFILRDDIFGRVNYLQFLIGQARAKG